MRKTDQVDSLTQVGSTINKDDESSEDVKNRIAKAQGVSFKIKIVLKNRKISLRK